MNAGEPLHEELAYHSREPHFHFVRAPQRLRFSDLVNGGLFLQARQAQPSEGEGRLYWTSDG